MKSVSWELELKFKNNEHYMEFIKKFLKIEKERNSLPTEFYVKPDDTDASHEGVIMTIYCVWGSRLKEYAKILELIEGEIQ